MVKPLAIKRKLINQRQYLLSLNVRISEHKAIASYVFVLNYKM